MKFSKKLWKHMKLNKHVTIIESPQNRGYFTRHGLHYNGYGKEILCNLIALNVKNLFQHTETPPICLGWDVKPPILVESTDTCNELSITATKVIVKKKK
jgi:hypothetical protein